MSSSTVISGPSTIILWLLTCVLVFFVLDAVATRRVPIYVEDHRGASMSDEQVLLHAVQAAYDAESNLWWIHDKKPFLVLEADRTYRISDAMYETIELDLQVGRHTRPLAMMNSLATTP